MQFYSIDDAAKILGISSQSLRRYVRRGVIPCGRIGRNYRVEEDVLRRFAMGEHFDGGEKAYVRPELKRHVRREMTSFSVVLPGEEPQEALDGGNVSQAEQAEQAEQAGQDSGNGKEDEHD